jgi:hypothetical protein
VPEFPFERLAEVRLRRLISSFLWIPSAANCRTQDGDQQGAFSKRQRERKDIYGVSMRIFAEPSESGGTRQSEIPCLIDISSGESLAKSATDAGPFLVRIASASPQIPLRAQVSGLGKHSMILR